MTTDATSQQFLLQAVGYRRAIAPDERHEAEHMKRSLADHPHRLMLACIVPFAIVAFVLVLQGADALLPAAIVALCAGMMAAMVFMALRR